MAKKTRAPLLDKYRSPYTFVPLNADVVSVDDAPPEHDTPLDGAISGTLTVELTADSPVFVRGGDPKDPKGNAVYTFSCLPDGRHFIPGSSLRGMLRNVVEIATFARLRANDHRYAIRDLHAPDLYGKYMADIVDGNPTPLVSAGWLEIDPGADLLDGDDDDVVGHLHPCGFGRVHYQQLTRFASENGLTYHPGSKKQTGPDKYAQWDDAKLSRRVTVSGQVQVPHGQRVGKRTKVKRFGDYLGDVQLGGRLSGELVFTGQPNVWEPDHPTRRKAKQRDFVFLNETHEPLTVTRRRWREFVFAHADDPQQRRLVAQANGELRYWLDPNQDRPGGRIPVFWLPDDDDTVRAMGMASMFRLTARTTTLEAIKRVQAEPQGLDVAESLFGWVPLHNDPRGPAEPIKGRVSVGHCMLTKTQELAPVQAAMGLPKASWWPGYVEQGGTPGAPPRPGPHGPQWKTWMDPDPVPRGWKRYRRHKTPELSPKLPTDRFGRVLDKQITRFRPLLVVGPARFQLRVHNVRPFELGALLWALDFGGDKQACHLLGFGKSLGLGQVRLRVADHTLEAVADESRTDLDAALRAFQHTMEVALPDDHAEGWAASRQIHDLVHAARPSTDPDDDLRHMRIDHSVYGNEYQQVKKRGWALGPITDSKDWHTSAGEARERRMVEVQRRQEDAAMQRAQREAERRAQARAQREEELLAQAATPVVERLAQWRHEVGDRALAAALWGWHQGHRATSATMQERMAHLRPDEAAQVEHWLVQSGLLERWNLPDQRTVARGIKNRVKGTSGKRRKRKRKSKHKN